jgi:hypothetical protein
MLLTEVAGIECYGRMKHVNIEYQFSSTATGRFQNNILFRPWDKQVTLNPAEGYINFRPRLLFMPASPSIKITILSV